MGLLGGGEDSLSASSGWGMMPPMNSSSDWGSSSNATGASHWQQSSSSTSQANTAASNANSSATSGTSRQSSSSSSTLNHHNSANSTDQLLSSSPKPSGSWAQAAGKGLVNTGAASTAITIGSNGPISGSVSNSHDRESLSSSYSNPVASLVGGGGAQQSQPSSVSSSSSQVASTNANSMNGGCGSLGMSANNSTINSNTGGNGSNVAVTSNPLTSSSLSSSTFQAGSSNISNNNTSSSSGGLIGGSGSSNPIDAAAVNKQRSGLSGSGISDLIGQLSDDFRETLLTEKWGSAVINQDSPWNLPPSPQSSPKDTSTWRCPVNSGTEIWENAVRHKKGSVGGPSGGGAVSLSSSVSLSGQPWCQAPTTHIGGTWGEEDEDSINHWSGVPRPSLSPRPSVGGGNGGNGGSLGSANSVGLGGFGGGAPSAVPSGLSAIGGGVGGLNSSSINNNWSAGSGALSNGTGSGISNYSLLNSANIGGGIGANSMGGGGSGAVAPNDNSNANSWNNGINDVKGPFESRQKPAGNWNNSYDQVDSSEGNWDKSGSMGGGNDFGTWNAPEKKDPSWDRDSNDSMKGGVDDGTACWGNPRGNTAQRGQTVPNWKDNNKFAGNKNGFNNNSWNNGGNGPSVGKPVNQPPPMLNRTWTDASGHRKSPNLWNEDAKSLNGNMTPNNMSDGQVDTSSWFNSKPTKPLTREMIVSSKQFRLLVDLGFKKDDVENALRNYNLRFDDALMDLESNKSYKTPNALGLNSNQPVKMQQQSNRNQFLGGNGSAAMVNAQSVANNNSLQNLVQRIQVAVNTGFLNPQILNQPLSNQNLEIISELLNQIKLLKDAQAQAHPGLNAGAKSQLDNKIYQITKNISILQNQLRSEHPSQHGPPQNAKLTAGSMQSNDFFKSNNDLYSSGGGGGMNDYGGSASGSRLQSWKQSGFNKQSNEDKMNALSADFVRAPGGLSKPNSTSSNWGFMGADDSGGWPSDLGQLGKPQHDDDYFGQQDFESYSKSTWKSKGLMDDDPRSPISQNAMMKDSVFSWTSGGGQSANPKANSLLGGNGNNVPGAGNGGQSQMDSLNSTFGFGGASGGSNPWSYNNGAGANQSANSQMFSDLNKKSSNPMSNKSTWSNPGLNSDYSDSLWNSGANNGAPGNAGAAVNAGKPRPPPGLSQVKNSNSSNSIWNSGLSSSNSNSEFLRLRNLTPQIDGSTLKTLCQQHGPLHAFHLFLNHGTAIARYSSREQAIKAQSALNNCVLGNTTILADLPAEAEVQHYLQVINGGGHSSNPNSGSQQSSSSNGAHNSHQSQQSQSAAQSAAQSQHHHQQQHLQQQHTAHHSQPYNSSWSNGTNASQQSTAGGVSGSAQVQQSNSASGQATHGSLYNRANSVGGAGVFGQSTHANSFSSQVSSPASSTLPYGAATAPGLVTVTHSSSSLPFHNVLNQQQQQSATANQFNSKMDNGLLSSWSTGSNSLWDSSSLGGGPVVGGAGLWSNAGFPTDRNTPIQSFLPGDLLAGENN